MSFSSTKTMFDYYVVVSLSMKASGAKWFRPYYLQHVDIYKMFYGKTPLETSRLKAPASKF
jgi:hypothetical protein